MDQRIKEATLILFLASTVVAETKLEPTADFETRCNGSGVVLCNGFESASQDIRPYLDFPYKENVYRGRFDSSESASGRGSLRFDIPPFTGADSSGNWSAPMGAQFGQGDTFYVQFRQKFSPEMLTERMGGDGWKQVIFFMDGGPSCANVEIATINSYLNGYPVMYTECGDNGFQLDIGNYDFLNQWSSDWPEKKHPHEWVECHYHNQKPPPEGGCLFYRADEWMTFYYEVEIGDWGKPNSKVRAYAGYEGGPLYQYVFSEDYVLKSNSRSTDHFSRIMFTPYNTNKPKKRDHALAQTWYDELIISRKPIPAPK